MIPYKVNNFPQQRVSGTEKRKPYWYANCIDYVIDAGLSFNDRADTELKLGILRGDMSDIIRRYVSEYFKGVHEFVVGANNPDIIINKNAKLKEKIGELAQQAFQQEFERQYQAMVKQAQQQGQDPNTVDPQQAMPDVEEFIKDFNSGGRYMLNNPIVKRVKRTFTVE